MARTMLESEGSLSVTRIDRREGLTSIVQTRNYNSGSTACGEKEACLDDGKDSKTTRALEDRARNDLNGELLVEQAVTIKW